MTQQVKGPLNQIETGFEARLEAWLRQRLPKAVVDLLTMQNRPLPVAGFKQHLPIYAAAIIAAIIFVIITF